MWKFLAVTAALLCGLWAREVSACSCKGFGDSVKGELSKAREGSAFVYRARVTDAERQIREGRVELEVLEVFKGSLDAGTKLLVPAGSESSCHVSFEPGEWLAYAHEKPDRLSYCSRTRKLSGPGDSELQWPVLRCRPHREYEAVYFCEVSPGLDGGAW